MGHQLLERRVSNAPRSLLDSLEWIALPPCDPGENDGLPFVTHQATLMVGPVLLRVYQLNTGQRIIDADDLRDFFGGEKECGNGGR